MRLFPDDKIVGIFKGFSEGGLEFHADIILKYNQVFQNIPMHGQFLVVELEGQHEAVLGRITSVIAQGKLAGNAGEDYGIRSVTDGRPIPEDLRESYLKYGVDIRVLGVLRITNEKLDFAPSHRRLPHVGSKVAFLSDEVLKEVAGHNLLDEHGNAASEFGYLAYGEFVYNGGEVNSKVRLESWMLTKSPSVIPKFKVEQLVSRRSFVFARAGFGKSNLVKLLFSNLYASNPSVTKRGGKKVPVGTVIFDPDGEYFWPDDSGRPGLCDVPHMEDKVVVFTNKRSSSAFYQSFVAGSIKLDVRRIKPSDVISISLSPEKQSQQNVQKLKGLNPARWTSLVDLIHRLGNTAPLQDIAEIVLNDRENDRQEMEMVAIRSNMTTIVRLLHDPSSQMMDMLFESLRQGKLCVVDISQMRGQHGLILSGIVLQQIFEHNQREFTEAEPKSLPTIAVLEEAQSVLGGSGGSESPYVAWVKEGRKYGLGAVLITQQPGSISDEILSQGDNWFIFHLLSAVDLQAVKKANAHFSNDLLSSLLNEPIPGNGIFWSSSGGKQYPLSIRVLSFENIYKLKDEEYNLPAANTFSQQLKAKYAEELERAKSEIQIDDEIVSDVAETTAETAAQEDVMEIYLKTAFQRVKSDAALLARVSANNSPWMGVQQAIEDALPSNLENKHDIAYQNVSRFMDEVFPGAWKTVKKQSKDGSRQVTYFEITS
jgi:hypothetical protein